MAECTELEWAVQVLVNNFDKYSSRRCCCKKPRRISKKDFRKMLSCELNHMLTDTGNRRAADKLICDLDENKDGRISFEEYWTLIGGIASPIAQIIRQQELSVKLTK
ncbi:S10AG protein, partial [Rynchops niger]|nr:protein S100-A16 [Rissa tridactyla]XP_054038737.1 protein S100-A16 [Rissa tridactyla]NWT47274.1 S10AG protein [Chroicocephalus maculipennis]NXN61057.1 S10AG protein [Rynchops niger]NXX00008.1 S10AG protein [Larus smithsonianus]NXV37105.1 S10AG protein [Rissa tridactyla]